MDPPSSTLRSSKKKRLWMSAKRKNNGFNRGKENKHPKNSNSEVKTNAGVLIVHTEAHEKRSRDHSSEPVANSDVEVPKLIVQAEVHEIRSRDENPNSLIPNTFIPDDLIEAEPNEATDPSDMPLTFSGNSTPSTSTSSSLIVEIEDEIQEVVELTGQRIFDVKYLFDQLIAIDHSPFNCTLKDFTFVKERIVGFQSFFTFVCKMCGASEIIKSHVDNNINKKVVQGVVCSGSSFSQLDEFCAHVNLPCISDKAFIKHNMMLGESFKDVSIQTMIEAGIEEKKIAIRKGNVDSNGVPTIAVVTDGSWGKRSYRSSNYNSLSGVACIIGFETKKVLFLGVRNSYCSICAIACSKNIQSKEHKCFKNWMGTSTAMEADGIVEGFKCSLSMHGLKYIQIIGDGDSSVTSALNDALPYGHSTIITKIECSNHLMRNYCTKLRNLTKKTENKQGSVPILMRKTLEKNILRLRKAIKGAIANTSKMEEKNTSEKIIILKEDIRNSPCHVFGDHTACKQYYCKNNNPYEENFVSRMKDCGLWYDIYATINHILNNAESLLMEKNNNIAEQYNAIVAKFIGGKRINYSLRGSYESRCYVAAAKFNTGSLIQAFKKDGETEVYAEKYDQRHKRQLELKRKYQKNPILKTKRAKRCATADEHYGAIEKEADTETDIFEKQKEDFLQKMQKSSDEIDQLQTQTIGQSSNPEWIRQRKLRLTASMFGQVCKLKSTTPCKNIVKTLLYTTFKGNDATRYGNMNEPLAIKDAEVLLGVQVIPCGLFVDENYPYLGASPDGLIGEQAIIEIKCPASASNLTPMQAIEEKKITFCVKMEENIFLKRNHNYYYQIQGQLHITNRKLCYFVVWTPKGIAYEQIEKDDLFWQSNVNKLKDFYLQCILPEIIDPRHPRKLPIRDRLPLN